MNGMDHRAAKALARCIADLIEAKIAINRISMMQEDANRSGQGVHNSLYTARADSVERAKKAEARIADWLRQPMTTAHLKVEPAPSVENTWGPWQYTKNAMPDDETSVLVAHQDTEVSEGYHEGKKWWYVHAPHAERIEIRGAFAWMEIPPAPPKPSK